MALWCPFACSCLPRDRRDVIGKLTGRGRKYGLPGVYAIDRIPAKAYEAEKS